MNLSYSVVLSVLCLLIYFFAWKRASRNDYTISLILLMLGGIVLRLYTAADLYLHPWDERYHALVAKHLMSHPLLPTLYEHPVLPFDYTSWTSNHVWVHKQPLPLWTMAISMSVFGVNELALRLPSVVLSTIGIGLTFFIASYIFSKKLAWLAAFFFSINGLIIELSAGRVATDHPDIFFMFFIELAIVFSILFVQKQRTAFNLLAGLSIGAAILSKWLPALIVLPVWLLIVLDSKRFTHKAIAIQLSVILVTILLVALPWQLYIYQYFPAEAAWEASFNIKHITTVLDERTGSFWYFLDQIRINYGELIYLPLIWFIWKYFKDSQNKKYLALLIWICIPLIFFSLAKTKMQAYILFISPALFIITAAFFFEIKEWDVPQNKKWLKTAILLLLIALPVRYCIERVKPFDMTNRNPDWAQDLKSFKNNKSPQGVLFNYPRPIEAMFYTQLTVYPDLPDHHTLKQLTERGYTIFINDNGKLPADIQQMGNLNIVKLRE